MWLKMKKKEDGNYPFSNVSKSQSNIAATFKASILNALAFFGSTSNGTGNECDND